MNRTNLIKKIAGRLLIEEEEAELFIRVWEEEVENALIREGGVGLMGFGSFILWKQRGRPGRNPRDNTSCMIAPRNSDEIQTGQIPAGTSEQPDGKNG